MEPLAYVMSAKSFGGAFPVTVVYFFVVAGAAAVEIRYPFAIRAETVGGFADPPAVSETPSPKHHVAHPSGTLAIKPTASFFLFNSII